jgi:hypothetical protein
MTLPSRDARLTRKQAADELTRAGLPTAPSTLASYATNGGGPPFDKYGQYAIYNWGVTLDWAIAKLVPVKPRPQLTNARVAA